MFIHSERNICTNKRNIYLSETYFKSIWVRCWFTMVSKYLIDVKVIVKTSLNKNIKLSSIWTKKLNKSKIGDAQNTITQFLILNLPERESINIKIHYLTVHPTIFETQCGEGIYMNDLWMLTCMLIKVFQYVLQCFSMVFSGNKGTGEGGSDTFFTC